MRVITVPMNDPGWAGYVAAHPQAGPFHLPAWTSVIADCYHFGSFVMAVVDADGAIVAGAPVIAARSPFGPLRWISLPFTDSCPLLMDHDQDPAAIVAAIQEFVLASPIREFEIRANLPEGTDRFPVDVGFIHQMTLPSDPADLHPHKSQRENRNRAIRMGVQVSFGNGPEDIATFYRMHTLTRRRHGVPVQPRRFFDLLQERVLEPGNGLVATARLDGTVLAAGVYLQSNGTLVAKYHASDPELPFAGAGHLIEWEMMVKGCREGFHTLDLGRTDRGADGLREYKSGWGHTESPLVYTHISRHTPSEGISSVGELPKRIIRNSPTWVTRAAGAVLYRWTA